MSKIDESDGANPLPIVVKDEVEAHDEVEAQDEVSKDLTPDQIKEIKEYEYLSKMQEINQKRKMKGGLDALKDLVNLGGDIATLSGYGIVAGIATKGATTTGSILHKGSKLVQSLFRSRGRKKS